MIKQAYKILTIGILIILLLQICPLQSGSSMELQNNEIRTSEQYHEETSSTQSIQSNNISEYWAIIAAPNDSTYGRNEPTYYRFANTADYFKETLCSHGWKEDHIKMLTLEDACLEKLLDAYEWMGEHDEPSDFALIILIGHGGPTGFEIYGPHTCIYREMTHHLELLDAENIAIIISACHSGGAIPKLKGEGRVILTACRENESTLETFSTSIINNYNIGETMGEITGVLSVEDLFNRTHDDAIMGQYWGEPQIDDQFPGPFYLPSTIDTTSLVDQHSSAPTVASCGSVIDSESSMAQSFIPTVNILTKVKLPVYAIWDTAPLICSIRSDLNGPDLTYYSLDPSNTDKIWGRFHTIDFPDINVIPGKTYYIVCQTADNGAWSWTVTSNLKLNVYENGKSFEKERGVWKSHSSYDHIFCTYGITWGKHTPCIPRRPAGVIDGFPETMYTYYISTVDLDDDQIQYCIDWGDGTQSWTGFHPSGDEVSLSHSWNTCGDYLIRVKAEDKNGQMSNWSSTLAVVIDTDQPPDTPTISGVNVGKTFEKYEYQLHAMDEDGDNIQYFVFWDDGETDWYGPFSSDETITVKHTWKEEGRYTVRVKVRDEHDRESMWTTCNVTMFPESAITKPKVAYYVLNKERHFRWISKPDIPVIIGPIDIVVKDVSKLGVEKVEFYVDEECYFIDYDAPYEWHWVGSIGFSPCLLKVVLSIDNTEMIYDMNVLKLF